MESLLDEMAIKAIVTKERYYRDSALFDALRECYHPDPLQTFIDITWYQGNVDGFIAGSREMAARGGGSTIHTITPVDVRINDEKAFCVSVGSIISRFSSSGTDYDLVSHCRFLSRLQKDGDGDGDSGNRGWKMLSMEVIYIHDAIIPAISEDMDVELRDAVDAGIATRESYKYLALLLGQKGYSVKDSLPGVDDPQRVETVMQKNLSWLK
ncbi:hypothetical protein BJX62DRAFT_249965 [Aspergillus germanicus]